jgi:hypothetical protein
VTRLHGIVAVLCADKMYRLHGASASPPSDPGEDARPRGAWAPDPAKSDGAAPART